VDPEQVAMTVRTPRWTPGVVGGALLGFLGDAFIVLGAYGGFRPEGAIAAVSGIIICACSSSREQLTVDPTGVGLRSVLRLRHLDWRDVRGARLVRQDARSWSVEVIEQSGRAHRVRSVGARRWRLSVDGSDGARAVALISSYVLGTARIRISDIDDA
jgi:hypothetical protein